jgi:hypothetical protein
MFSGHILFSQVMSFVPWKSLSRIVLRHQGDSGVRSLDCATLFRVLAFAQLTSRESLRDIEVCLNANQHKLYHMGIGCAPARSTLSDALGDRDWRIFHELAMMLSKRARALYAGDAISDLPQLDATVYALDASTIDLCLSLFPWAHFRRSKAAVKLHTLLDLRGSIPSFIHISDGKLHEVSVLDFMPTEAGAIYVMDRGYWDFARLYRLHCLGAFFVIRTKSNFRFKRVSSKRLTDQERQAGVVCDQVIRMSVLKAKADYPHTLRRIRFKDPVTQKTLVFLTNNLTLPALVIAAIYKNRWQVELFFKWIKQHLKIKHFLGNSENAVKVQIWSAIATYLLVAVIKKECHLDAPLYTILQVFSVSLLERIELSSAFQPHTDLDSSADAAKQLNLF